MYMHVCICQKYSFSHTFAVIIDIWDNDCIKKKNPDVICGLRAHNSTVGVTTINQCCLTNTFYFRQDSWW